MATNKSCAYCVGVTPVSVRTRKGVHTCKRCGEDLNEEQVALWEAKWAATRELYSESSKGRGLLVGENQEKNWTKGRRVPALPASHPDHFVTNEREMDRAYEKNGISRETGDFKTEGARNRAIARAKQEYNKKR